MASRATPRPRPGVARPHLRVIPGGAAAPVAAPVRSPAAPRRPPPGRRAPAHRPVRRPLLARAAARAAAGHRARLARSRRPGLPFVTLAVVAVGALVFGLVLLNLMLAQSALRLQDLQARSAAEEARGRELRLRLAEAESPARLAQEARGLGLVQPQRREVIEAPAPVPPEEALAAGPQGAARRQGKGR